MNAAKHAGVDEVSVYGEVAEHGVSIFVKDPRSRVRPRRRLGRAGHPRLDPGANGTPRREDVDTLGAGQGHRGDPHDGEPDMTDSIRIFIVDDHDLFRAGVRNELPPPIEVIGEASEVDAAIEMIIERRPDLVLVDVHMPNGGGRAVIQGVLAQHEQLFLAVSASDAPEDVVSTVRAGARGYVTKTIAPADLADAIHRVVDGDAVFSPRLAGFVLDAFSAIPVGDIDPELDQLTPREREVLQHIARGYTYREIGEQLFISPKTVENHVSAVLRKLHLSNRHELSRWAHDRNIG